MDCDFTAGCFAVSWVRSVINDSCGWRSRNQYPLTFPPIFLSVNTRRSMGQAVLPQNWRKQCFELLRHRYGHLASVHRHIIWITPPSIQCIGVAHPCSSDLTKTSEVESASHSLTLTLTVTHGPIKYQSTAPPCGPGCVLQDWAHNGRDSSTVSSHHKSILLLAKTQPGRLW